MRWLRVAICNPLTQHNGWFAPTWRNDLAMGGPKYIGPGAASIMPPGLVVGAPIEGPAVLDVLRKHDVVITQHLCPPEFYRALREDGSRVTKVLQWFDWEAVPAAGYYSPGLKSLGEWMALHTLAGTKANRFGQHRVDPYEMHPADWNKYPHAWCTDIRDTLLAKEYILLVAEIMRPYSGLINGVMFDNCMDRSYFGTATNAPDVAALEAKFRYTLKRVLWGARKATLGETWGNCGATSKYRDVDVKWSELLLAESPNPHHAAEAARGSITEGTASRGGKRQGLVFSPEPTGHGITWVMDNGKRWQELAELTNDLPCLGLVTFRSGKFCLLPQPVEEA